jgi:hypothetical protein
MKIRQLTILILIPIFNISLASCKKTETPTTSRPPLTAPNGQPISIPPGKPFTIPANNNDGSKESSTTDSSIRLFTQENGALIVGQGRITWKAEHKTWSSWWYPLLERDLTKKVGSEISTLEKFDRFVKIQTGQNSMAQKYQDNNIYDDSYEEWAGYCDARAYAASLHPEPLHSALLQGICFTPADLKALLVLTYTRVNPNDWQGLWGQPNTIRTQNVNESDLFPQEFIRLLQVEMGDHRRNLIFDSDPTQEVWTESAYQATLEIQKTTDANKVNGFLDVLAPSYALDDAEKRQERVRGIGTIEIPFNYTFTLYGQWNRQGQFVVERGEWTGDSIRSHPDFAVQLPQDPRQARIGANPYVSAELVDDILRQAQRAPGCH